jgi:hypothetical protein
LFLGSTPRIVTPWPAQKQGESAPMRRILYS